MTDKSEHFIFNIDGCEHTKKEFTDCCWETPYKCHECGKPMHRQGVYGGLVEMCESNMEDCIHGGVIGL